MSEGARERASLYVREHVAIIARRMMKLPALEPDKGSKSSRDEWLIMKRGMYDVCI